MEIHPVTLAGGLVRLEPLSLTHLPGLTAAGQDETIWRLMPYGFLNNAERLAAHVQDLLARREQGTIFPFVVIHQETGQVIGGTQYLSIDPQNRNLEVGGTWYAPTYQRTGVNTECKYLLLRHAFEVLGCLRVQLKTDLRNERSQRAIERIGARREGVLRKDRIMPDGYVRSTVVYSIVEEEWPEVKALLERLKERGRRLD